MLITGADYRNLALNMKWFHGETRYRGGGGYAVPYDSTQGVPNYVFIGFWIIIILFLIRLGWEYRDEIFKKKG